MSQRSLQLSAKAMCAVHAEVQLDSVREQLSKAEASAQSATQRGDQLDSNLRQRTEELQEARAALKGLESKHAGTQACTSLSLLCLRICGSEIAASLQGV